MTRRAAFVRIILGYLVAFAAALIIVTRLELSLFVTITLFQIISVAILFIFSRSHNNTAFFNPYWSVMPILMGWFLAFQGDAPLVRKVLLLVIITAWGLRLTYNWARGWHGFHQEDWTYRDFREKTGRWYWLLSFVGLHCFPASLVLLGLLPLYPSLVNASPLNILDGIAFIVGVLAVFTEGIADNQLYHFRQTQPPSEKLLDTGLWAYSRHPNYLGEMGFWVSLALFGLAAEPTQWWRSIGALSIISLFVFITIPMIERRHLSRRPDYQNYMQFVPMVLPRLRLR